MASGFLTIKIQSARFSKIRKFVPLIIFNCEPIFHVIRVLNIYICQKTVPAIFEKKCLSLSLLCLSKLSLKVENGSCCQHRAPPVLRRADAPGLNNKDSMKWSLLLISTKYYFWEQIKGTRSGRDVGGASMGLWENTSTAPTRDMSS